MSGNLLIPNRYKKVGWLLLIPSIILGLIIISTNFDGLEVKATVFAFFNDEAFGQSQSFQFIQTNIINTLTGVLFIVGALMVGFSKEKREDEFIAKIRLSSLMWAVLVNYILLLLAFVFIYGMAFLNIMLYNMFTVLILFIARFNYILYKNTKWGGDEK